MSLKHCNKQPCINSHHGFTLLEVMISSLVLSIGLLGVAGLQITSLKNSDSAYFRSQAALYSYEILDRMRANRDAAIGGDYDVALTALSDLGTPASGNIAQNDRYDWLRNLDGVVPDAKGAIDCDTGSVCLITVQWDDSRAENAASTKQHMLAAQL